MTKELDAAPGDIRSLKYRIHELEGEVIGYKRILDGQGKAEPVAWSNASWLSNPHAGHFSAKKTDCFNVPLYTSPPDPGGLLRDALSNLNDLADQKNAEIDALKEAMRLALGALRLPCDRWNKTQTEIVNAAIAQIEALKGPAP